MTKVITVPFMPKYDGYTVCPWLVLIRKGASPFILDHEMCHVRQMKQDGYFRWMWRYAVSKKWRAKYEAEAYAAAVKAGQSLDSAASAMFNLYNLPITFNQARDMINAAR